MIRQLIEKIQKTKAPICVGLDPMLSYVPEHIQAAAFEQYGETLEGVHWSLTGQSCPRSFRLSSLTG